MVTATRGTATCTGAFDKTLLMTMRKTHAAGEWLFVDCDGDGVDRLTAKIRMAQRAFAAGGSFQCQIASTEPVCAPAIAPFRRLLERLS